MNSLWKMKDGEVEVSRDAREMKNVIQERCRTFSNKKKNKKKSHWM